MSVFAEGLALHTSQGKLHGWLRERGWVDFFAEGLALHTSH